MASVRKKLLSLGQGRVSRGVCILNEKQLFLLGHALPRCSCKHAIQYALLIQVWVLRQGDSAAGLDRRVVTQSVWGGTIHLVGSSECLIGDLVLQVALLWGSLQSSLMIMTNYRNFVNA